MRPRTPLQRIAKHLARSGAARARRHNPDGDGVLVRAWLYKDQLKPIAELDGQGNLIARFVYGSKTNVPDVVMRYDSGLVTSYRVISDHLGSPILAVNVNNSADVPFTAEYSAFGERTITSGAASEDWMVFGFAGGIYDADTGLTRFGARDHNPVIGRWVSKDPIRFTGGLNLYQYANGDSTNYVDPNGRWVVPAVIVAGGFAVGAWLSGEFRDAESIAVFESKRRWPGDDSARPAGGEADAFRHCFASCYLSNEIGSTLTLVAMDGREYWQENVIGHSYGFCEMDRDNNAVGREIADQGANSASACASRCVGAVGLGIARTITP